MKTILIAGTEPAAVDARRALALPRTRAVLLDVLATPSGSWPESQQAWSRLTDETFRPGAPDALRTADAAARLLVNAALDADWPAHPDRRAS